MNLSLDQVVVGGYRIERKLGSGGQGQVYLEWRELFILMRHQWPNVVRLVSGLVGKKGLASKELTEGVTEKEGNALTLNSARTWRAEGQVAVDVWLWNSGTRPWVAEGAVLRGAKGQVLKPLPLWQSTPIAPGQKGHVVVEVLATDEQAQGTYTLTRWDEGRQRTVVLGEVTFP